MIVCPLEQCLPLHCQRSCRVAQIEAGGRIPFSWIGSSSPFLTRPKTDALNQEVNTATVLDEDLPTMLSL